MSDATTDRAANRNVWVRDTTETSVNYAKMTREVQRLPIGVVPDGAGWKCLGPVDVGAGVTITTEATR